MRTNIAPGAKSTCRLMICRVHALQILYCFEDPRLKANGDFVLVTVQESFRMSGFINILSSQDNLGDRLQSGCFSFEAGADQRAVQEGRGGGAEPRRARWRRAPCASDAARSQHFRDPQAAGSGANGGEQICRVCVESIDECSFLLLEQQSEFYKLLGPEEGVKTPQHEQESRERKSSVPVEVCLCTCARFISMNIKLL